jgi:uncharacterized protein (TIRG00374 family)
MHVLLRRTVPFSLVIQADFICNMANSLLPLRAGEFAMALLLARRTQGRGGEFFSNVFVDRLLGLIAILTIFLAVLPGYVPSNVAGRSLAHNSVYYVLTFGGLVACMFLVVSLEEWFVARATRVFSWLPLLSTSTSERIIDRLRAIINGLRVLFHLRTSLPVFFLSLATWACIIACNYFGMLSVIAAPSVTSAVFVTFLTTIGLLLVPTPGGVGTVHGTSVLALSMFGVGVEQALAYAILCHALTTLANIGLGMISAHALSFRWGPLFERSGE